VATLGAENSALEMMIFSDGGGGRGSGRRRLKRRCER